MNGNKFLPGHRIHFSSPIGIIRIEDDGEALTALSIDRDADYSLDCESELLLKTKRELMEYFEGRRFDFDIPLHLNGTEFQLRVWNALREIPYAQTVSYLDIARITGNSKACRAVGGANGKNPIMIIVPCHRVIGSGGSLVGFSAGMEAKRFLLRLEQNNRHLYCKG